MTRKTKYDSYDDAYKATAVALSALPKTNATDVEKILDVHPVMLYRWKKELTDGLIMANKDNGTLEAEQKRELKRLRKLEKAHELLLIKHDLLKKSIQLCSDRKKKSSNL